MSHRLQEIPKPSVEAKRRTPSIQAPSFGHGPRLVPAAADPVPGDQSDSSRVARNAGPRRSVLCLCLTAIGALMVVTCGIEAWCRWTGSQPTLAEVLHAAGLFGQPSLEYEPGKGFGQIMGYLGGSLIFLTLGYPLRKHVFRSPRFGRLKTWLDVHIFFGITGTAIITLHTAGHMRGIVAVCYFATLMAFASGVVGRFLYVHLPRQVTGREQQLGEMERELAELGGALECELSELGIAWKAPDTKDAGSAGLVQDLRGLLAQRGGARRSLRSLQRRLRRTPGLDREIRRSVEQLAARALRKRLEVRSYSMVRHLFGSWHKFHLPFTYTLFGILAVHIAVAILFYVEN